MVAVYDWYEPGKDYDESWYSGPVAEYAHVHIRKAAYRLAKFLNDENGIDKAILESYRQTIKSLVDRNLPICYQTIEVYNSLL